MINKWLDTLALLVLLSISWAPSVNAQAITTSPAWSSPEEVRTQFSKMVDSISNRVPSSDQSTWAVNFRQQIADLQQKIDSLSYPALDQLGKFADRQSCATMSDALAAGDSFTQNSKFAPRLAIVPPNFTLAVAGTTCSTSATSAGTIDGEKIGLYVDRGLSLVSEVACESLVVILGEGSNLPGCIAFGIVKGVEEVLDSLINHQEFCNSLLSGAKVEGILDDVINVHGDVGALDTHLTNVNNQITSEFTAVDTHLTNVDTHIAAEFVALVNQLNNQGTQSTALLSAYLKQVMKLQLEPDGVKKIAPAILTCTGTNCPNVLATCPAAGCSWNNVGHLP